MFDRNILLEMMNNNKIKGFTIMGSPSKELYEAYFNRKDLVEFFKCKNIECKIFDYGRTDIGIYFPQLGEKIYTNICAICVSKIVDKNQLDNIIALFDEVFEYYQANIPCRIINKILNLYANEPFTFSDMLMLIPDTQSDVSRKIGKSKQVISDMKYGKCKCNIEVLALLMKEYPLLPWDEFIKGFIK